MTYCLGIKIDQAIVMVSDSRTNAGVDNINSYSKMWRFNYQNERQFVICMSGNLATTQAVIAQVEKDIEKQSEVSLISVASLPEAAEYLGKVSVKVQQNSLQTRLNIFEATFLLAGEILGAERGLFMIYPEGNFITPSSKHPFLQIGEVKYGKPILDRVMEPHTPLEKTILCGLLSMDAAVKSNLSVGPPIEVCVLKVNEINTNHYFYFEEGDQYLQQLRVSWDTYIHEAFDRLGSFPWSV